MPADPNEEQKLRKVNMAARLRAMATVYETMGAPEETVIKHIFDLKGAAQHLDELDELTKMIGDATSIAEWSDIKKLAKRIRDTKSSGSDPEPKIA